MKLETVGGKPILEVNSEPKDVNYSGLILVDADFSNLDLRGANFEGADLRDANFGGANLEGVNFRSAKLEGASLPNIQYRVRGCGLCVGRGCGRYAACVLRPVELEEKKRKSHFGHPYERAKYEALLDMD